MANVTRTSMFLDRDLVARAQQVLGTTTVVDTVHEALRRTTRSHDWSEAFDKLATYEWLSNEEIEALDGPKPEGYDPFDGVTEEELEAARASFQKRRREIFGEDR